MALNLCDERGHDEVCYAGKYCPACKLLERIEDLEREARDLQSELDEMKEKS